MIAPKSWKGGDLKGEWVFTRKLDGVRMLRDAEGNPVSRRGKPLYNLSFVDKSITDAEIFRHNWSSSVSAVRTSSWTITPPLSKDNVYSLEPLDPRLVLYTVEDPTSDVIAMELRLAIMRGDEGLVLRQGDTWLKVKSKETYDVPIYGFEVGTGKNGNVLGAIITEMGKVGVGFTDEERENIWIARHGLLDTYVEVECMSLTAKGKFRHPVFKRIRWDK